MSKDRATDSGKLYGFGHYVIGRLRFTNPADPYLGLIPSSTPKFQTVSFRCFALVENCEISERSLFKLLVVDDQYLVPCDLGLSPKFGDLHRTLRLQTFKI